MPSIRIDTDIFQPVRQWIESITEVTRVIKDKPGRPRPNKFPYITVNLITSLQKIGSRDSLEYDAPDEALPISETNPDDQWNIGGQRRFVISVNAYVDKKIRDFFDAQDLLIKLQDAVDDPNQRTILKAAGLSVFSVGDILPISELIETGWESRAQVDITMSIASNRKTRLGAIEKVEIQGTIDGQEDEEFLVE